MKPCPRCGAAAVAPGENITIEIIEAIGSFWGHCNVCGYNSRESPLDNPESARQQALDEWNRRPLEDALQEQLEAQTEETESLYRDLDRLRNALGVGGPRDVGSMLDDPAPIAAVRAAWKASDMAKVMYWRDKARGGPIESASPAGIASQLQAECEGLEQERDKFRDQVAAWEWLSRSGHEMYCAGTAGYRVWRRDDDPQLVAGEGATPTDAVLAAWRAREK
ncbi:MAG: hypothetical protein KAY24_01050 [Candidatus Eisenbacteria sp.]|nr:hypothetical protein [Candidatus Eisenbacteria bacterium]